MPTVCGSGRCTRPTNRRSGAWTRDGWRCRRCRDRMPPHLRKPGVVAVGSAERVVFATPRAAEFLERRALQAQTGQPAERFGDVVVKELVDNALDATESAGVAPEIALHVAEYADSGRLVTVLDNGPGLSAEVVERILDFDVLVSDKAAYRSPTRGAQGNAFKTLVGIPAALGITAPVAVEARGVRHELSVSVDPGGNVVVQHERRSGRSVGTAVTVPLPGDLTVDAERWARGFALVNPHATVSWQANGADPARVETYKPTAPGGWRKPLPTDPTSPHWYDQTALTRLVFAHIAVTRAGGRDLPVGEFVRTFDGLTSTAKAKAVRAAVPGVERLGDFAEQPERVADLLAAMQGAAKIPKPTILGSVGEDHLRACLDSWYGVERFWYKRKRLDHHGVPWVLEVAVAVTERPADVFYAVNYSPTFGDPLRGTMLDAGEITTTGAASFLQRCDAFPDGYNGHRRAAVVHVVCPAAEFLDKGKSALEVPCGRR